jgi:transcription initiation factor TFIIIB Brf1 subunit/transcription initiation factor TFIIB
MTRRHDERWAVPIGNAEYIHHLEAEFFRLREVERTLDEQVAFLRNERDRFKDAADELARELHVVRQRQERIPRFLRRILGL